MAISVILLDSVDGGSVQQIDATDAEPDDLLIFVIDRDSGGVENVTPCIDNACGDTVPSGEWTAVPRAAAGSHATRIVYVVAEGTETTFDINLGSGSDGSAFLIALRASGDDSIVGVSDAEIVASGSAGTSIVAPSVDSAAAGSILINYWKLCSSNNNGRSITEPGGTSLVDDHRSGGTWDTRSIRYDTVGSGATGTRTATASHEHDWFAASLVVEVEGEGPPPGDTHSRTVGSTVVGVLTDGA